MRARHIKAIRGWLNFRTLICSSAVVLVALIFAGHWVPFILAGLLVAMVLVMLAGMVDFCRPRARQAQERRR